MTRYEESILKLFYYNPMTHFGIRELGRKTHLDTKTVMKYLKELSRRKLIVKYTKKKRFPYFEANRLSPIYRFEKSHALIKKIIEADLVPFLEHSMKPKAIVLFGSVKKGTYHEKSDIDIFVQAAPQRLNLSRFERTLGHKIRILFETDLKELTPGLLENIYNGEILSGKLEVLL